MNTSQPVASGNGDGGYIINGTATNRKTGRAIMTENETVETRLNLGRDRIGPEFAKIESAWSAIVPKLSPKTLIGLPVMIDKAPIRTVYETLNEGISTSPRPKSIGAPRIPLPVNSLTRYQPGNANTSNIVTIV